jgi:hypothetical protein
VLSSADSGRCSDHITVKPKVYQRLERRPHLVGNLLWRLEASFGIGPDARNIRSAA